MQSFFSGGLPASLRRTLISGDLPNSSTIYTQMESFPFVVQNIAFNKKCCQSFFGNVPNCGVFETMPAQMSTENWRIRSDSMPYHISGG